MHCCLASLNESLSVDELNEKHLPGSPVTSTPPLGQTLWTGDQIASTKHSPVNLASIADFVLFCFLFMAAEIFRVFPITTHSELQHNYGTPQTDLTRLKFK